LTSAWFPSNTTRRRRRSSVSPRLPLNRTSRLVSTSCPQVMPSLPNRRSNARSIHPPKGSSEPITNQCRPGSAMEDRSPLLNEIKRQGINSISSPLHQCSRQPRPARPHATSTARPRGGTTSTRCTKLRIQTKASSASLVKVEVERRCAT